MKRYLSVIIILFVVSTLYAQTEKNNIWNPLKANFVVEKELLDFKFSKQNSVDNGTFWESIGPNNNDIMGIAFGSQNGEIIFAASRDNGIFKTLNGGLEWKTKNNGITGDFIRTIASHPSNNKIVLAGSYNNGLFRTTNGGESWEEVDAITDSIIFAITFDQKHCDTVYVGTMTKGIYRSWDAGLTWQNLSSDSIFTTALEIICDPQFSNVLYYLEPNEKRVYKSLDYGNTWNIFFQDEVALSLAINPDNSNIIFMGTYDNLYKTTNGGIDWETSYVDSNQQIIEDILFDSNNTDNIYLGTVTKGVFKSSDGGQIWNELNDSLASSVVVQLQFNPLLVSTMYAATIGNAITKIENLATGIAEEKSLHPKSIILYQNYPNPFNPSTTIKYSIPSIQIPLLGGVRGGFVTLKIYDILGREVATLVKQQQKAGNYEVHFDASNLTSGIYFYRLHASSGLAISFVESKKMLLIK